MSKDDLFTIQNRVSSAPGGADGNMLTVAIRRRRPDEALDCFDVWGVVTVARDTPLVVSRADACQNIPVVREVVPFPAGDGAASVPRGAGDVPVIARRTIEPVISFRTGTRVAEIVVDPRSRRDSDQFVPNVEAPLSRPPGPPCPPIDPGRFFVAIVSPGGYDPVACTCTVTEIYGGWQEIRTGQTGVITGGLRTFYRWAIGPGDGD